jgi:GNAT superfamily N-acetyltransferase
VRDDTPAEPVLSAAGAAGPVIRRAQLAECAVLTVIAHAAKRHWGYPEDWIRLWAKDLTVTPAFVREHPTFVAAVGDDVVGFYALGGQGDPLELEHLWVRPAHMRQGVGVALVRHAMAEARARGVRALRIAADPNAEAFYVTQGARRIGEVPSTPEGRRLPLLVLDVSP